MTESPHEVSDASPKLILGAMITSAVVVVASSALLWWGWTALELSPPEEEAITMEEPRLKTHPGKAFAQQERQWERRLNSAGWVDRDESIVHIPIEQAMTLLVERGLPETRAGEEQK